MEQRRTFGVISATIATQPRTKVAKTINKRLYALETTDTLDLPDLDSSCTFEVRVFDKNP